MPVSFHYADVKFRLRGSAELKAFIEKQLRKAGTKQPALKYIFCSDEFLLQLNRKFLNHNFYTDILTFPLHESGEEINAEIYISIERVKENALNLKIDFATELRRVIFHGALHLLGYKDKSKKEQANMRARENEWLERFKK